MRRGGRRLCLSVVMACACCAKPAPDPGPPIALSIDLAPGQGATGPAFQGWVYFRGDVSRTLLDPLAPRFWRTSTHLDQAALDLFSSYGVRTTLVVGDAYASSTPPWADWLAYEAFVKTLFATTQQLGLTVDSWDVWNEPETSWPGTLDQFAELVAHTAKALREADPKAKIVAPSMAGLSSADLDQVLTLFGQLADAGTHLDAFSWHSFDQPESVPAFAAQARAFFAAHPAMCNPACPELHVNEFSGGEHDHLPGWAVGWLTALERAKVDWGTKACWEVPRFAAAPWNGCEVGLAGLLSPDGRATLPTYWVSRAYAELDRRAVADASQPGWAALGGRRADGAFQVLVGRYGCGLHQRWCTFQAHNEDDDPSAPGRASLTVRGLPGTLAAVTVTRIPRRAPQAPLAAPEPVSQTEVPVVGDTAVVALESVEDGAAYVVTLQPR